MLERLHQQLLNKKTVLLRPEIGGGLSGEHVPKNGSGHPKIGFAVAALHME